VAEVTSLGLVQMTRKRVGQGLHEVFAETCEACNGRGYHIHTEPVEKKNGGAGTNEVAERKSGGRGGRGKQGAGPAAAAVAAASSGKSGRRSRAGAASDDGSGKAAGAAEETGDFDELDASPVTEDDRTGPSVGDDDLEVSVIDVSGDGAAADEAAPEAEPPTSGGSRTRRRRVASSPVTTL
jgi:ribonuclease E